MANHFEPTDEDRKSWEAWVDARPQALRDVIRARGFAPWTLYRMASSGHRVFIYSYAISNALPYEISLQVVVLGKYNLVKMERCVFGIAPDDLTECELPLPGEPIGVTLTPEEQQAHIKSMREHHRREREDGR